MQPNWLYTLDGTDRPVKQWHSPFGAVKAGDPSGTKDVAIFVLATADHNGAVERFHNRKKYPFDPGVSRVYGDLSKHYNVICLLTGSISLIDYAIRKIGEVLTGERGIKKVILHAHSNTCGMGFGKRILELRPESFSREFYTSLAKDCILSFFGCETARGDFSFTEKISKNALGRLCVGSTEEVSDMGFIAIEGKEGTSLIPVFTEDGMSLGSEAKSRIFKDGEKIADIRHLVSKL